MPKSLLRRHYLLLEVMMAFFLVVLCAIPLFYPHAYMLRAERGYLKTIQLDKAVDLIYAHLLQQLYENQIDWDQLSKNEWISIDKAFYHTPLPFRGEYRFQLLGKESEEKGNLYSIEMKFFSQDNPSTEPLHYLYNVAIKRTAPDAKVAEPPKKVEEDE